MVEVVYQKAEEQAAVDPSLIAAIDLGVTTLAALTSTKPGLQPLLINGRPLKSQNQHYNKQRARYQSHLAKAKRFTSRQLDRITTKRNRRITAYLHTASRRIIHLLVSEGIGTLVVGKNPLWKQEVGLGRKNTQAFVQIPHARLIDLLTYKAKLVGIDVVIVSSKRATRAKLRSWTKIPSRLMSLSGPRSHASAGNGRSVASLVHQMADGSMRIVTAATIYCAKHSPIPSGRR